MKESSEKVAVEMQQGYGGIRGEPVLLRYFSEGKKAERWKRVSSLSLNMVQSFSGGKMGWGSENPNNSLIKEEVFLQFR